MIEGLFIEFNKIIVIAMFFYIVISYFLYQLLSYYLKLASINPNFSRSDLFEPLLRKIPCEVVVEGKSYQGHLTNWDDEGCFIKLNEAKDFSNKVTVKISFRDRDFTQEGEVVAATPDSSGVGIKFESSAKEMNVFNWSEFMEIVHELGFQPERLR